MFKSISRFKEYTFLFSELVKRDFKKKYKGTYLGMIWSVLSPLLTLLVMSLVFTNFFGRNDPLYVIYLFCGNIVFSYFSDATSGGMGSIFANSSIISKVPVPKYMFLLSRNVSSLINFGLTFVVFIGFCIIYPVKFTWAFLLLIFPIICLTVFSIGIGMLLSTLFFFFRDLQYLWSVFMTLLMYLSAIFYKVEDMHLSEPMQRIFLLNPIYVYIKYFRVIVIDNGIPSPQFHLLALGYALAAFLIGALVYKKCNHKFIYYI